MKKQLNIDAIKNELEGSVFFPTKPKDLAQPEPSSTSAPDVQPTGSAEPTVVSRDHDTMVDTTIPRYHDTTVPSEDELLEAVRRAVKQIGKEAATQRLTLEEKKALRAIEFTYAQQGIMTSGNEIIRIGMNYLLQDYQRHGETSILAKVLKRLNS